MTWIHKAGKYSGDVVDDVRNKQVAIENITDVVGSKLDHLPVTNLFAGYYCNETSVLYQ